MKNNKSIFLTGEYRMELWITFFTSTALICILEGILGSIFYPGIKVDFAAFFSPPLFGFLSVIFGLTAGTNFRKAKREIGALEIIIRRLVHLLLIIGSVIFLNAANGKTFTLIQIFIIIICITAIYLLVYLVIYLNDRKSALDFNQKLKNYQEKNNSIATFPESR